MPSTVSLNEGSKNAPPWVIQIVLIVRLIGSMLFSVSVFAILAYFIFPISIFPPAGFTTGFYQWLAYFSIVVVISSIVIIIPMMFLSWVVAGIFYKPIREDLISAYKGENTE